jgi:hypothetical protein
LEGAHAGKRRFFLVKAILKLAMVHIQDFGKMFG